MIEVELPDGRVVEFPEGTDTATMERALADFAKPADFSGVRGSASTKAAPSTMDRVAREAGLGLRAGMRGAYGLPGIVLDPLLGAAGLGTSQQAAESHADAIGLPRPETGSERVGGQITEALTSGGGLMGLGRHLAGKAPGALRGIGELLTTAPRAQVAGLVGGAGAAGVARESGGGQGAQTLAGLVGGLTPAAAGAGGAMSLRGLVRGGVAGRERMQQNISDFNSIGAQPSVGQAAGNVRMRGAESLLSGAPTSTARMGAFAERQAEDIGAGLRAKADAFMPNASGERAGRAVEAGIDTFAGNVGATRKALYWQADRYIPNDTPLPLERTNMALAELTTPTPGAAATTGSLINPKILQIAQNLSDDLAQNGGNLPYAAVKELRTRIGQELADFTLSPDRPTREFKRLYAALSQDLEEAARKQGPAAEMAARRANDYTRASAERLEQVQRVVDKNGGPEKVFSAVMSGTQDGGTTLRAVMQSLPKEGQRAVTAAVIKRMGLATPGQQGAAGDVFSAQTFLTNWNKVSPEARRALFDRHGPAFVKDMDKIARTAENIRTGSRVYANPSGTANKAAAYSYWASLPAAAAAIPFTGGAPLVGLVLGGVGANAMARAMTNPKFVSWLARATEMPAGALPQQLVILRGVAEDDPDVAEVLAELEQQPSQ